MSFPLHSADLSHSLGKGLGFLSRCLYPDCFSHQEGFPIFHYPTPTHPAKPPSSATL